MRDCGSTPAVEPPLHAARIRLNAVAGASGQARQVNAPAHAFLETNACQSVQFAEKGKVLRGTELVIKGFDLRRHADLAAHIRSRRVGRAVDGNFAVVGA